MSPARHPSDEQRAAAARPALDAYMAAVRADDAAAVAAVYAEDCVWLTADGAVTGRDGAARRHAQMRDRLPQVERVEVEALQQHGAHAVVRWRGLDGAGAPVARGMAVMEIRRGLIVFKADHVDVAEPWDQTPPSRRSAEGG